MKSDEQDKTMLMLGFLFKNSRIIGHIKIRPKIEQGYIVGLRILPNATDLAQFELIFILVQDYTKCGRSLMRCCTLKSGFQEGLFINVSLNRLWMFWAEHWRVVTQEELMQWSKSWGRDLERDVTLSDTANFMKSYCTLSPLYYAQSIISHHLSFTLNLCYTIVVFVIAYRCFLSSVKSYSL